MDCSLPGSSVRGIFQAIVLEWIAISFSKGSSPPRARTQVSRIVGSTFNILTLKEKRNRKSRGYITKLGFDQHPDSNNAGKFCVTAHLESQLGKGPRQPICSVDETSENAVWCWFIIPGCKLISSSICEQITALVSC